MRLKDVLIGQGVWSQYLEVGIGPDAEIFTKCRPLAAVGTGAEVGIHPKSEWNNPEPEVVLAVARTGRVVGATLGNDVNLRDFEGRSALLLGKAKDNNALVRALDRSSGCSTSSSRWTTCGRASWRCTSTGPDGFAVHRPQLDARDQPRPARDRRAHHRSASSVSRRLDAVPRDDVRADRRSPGARQRLHPRRSATWSRCRRRRSATLVNRVNHTDKIAPLDVRDLRADGEPGQDGGPSAGKSRT